MKKLFLALGFSLYASAALAQTPVFCPTRPAGDTSNACASTQFVSTALTGLTLPITSITGMGTGVLTAIQLPVGSAGSLVVNGGGALTIASTSSSALAVGRLGATNPVLQIDASGATQQTGVNIFGGVAGSGVSLTAISSGINETLALNALGNGNVLIGNASTGAVTISNIAYPQSINSGGIPYFSSSAVIASSGALTLNGVVYGGGAGGSPGVTTAGTNGQAFLGVTSSAPNWATLSQDCTITNAGVLTCLKTNNVAFTSAAVTAIGTSGATIPLLNTANTWATTQTFTVAPVFTNQSSSRTALGLGTAATQATGTSGATLSFLNGTNTWSGVQTFTDGNLALVDVTTPANSIILSSNSSTALTLNRTLTFDVGNAAHTLKFGTTANTITFPSLASYTVITNGDTGTVTTAMLANASTTVNGQTCTLGSTCTIATSASAITIGTTTITSGNTNTILYQNGASPGGTIGEITTANNGVLVTSAGGVPSISSTLPSGIAATSMALTTPAIGVATGTSVALGGCTIGTLSICTAGGNLNLADAASANNFSIGFSGTPGGYTGNAKIDATGLKIGHNSAVRDIEFQINSITQVTISTNGGLSVGTTSDPGVGLIYTNSASFMMRTKTSYTNGAAAAAGTIANAPAAGNPTKWIPVDDNGTTRYIPAW